MKQKREYINEWIKLTLLAQEADSNGLSEEAAAKERIKSAVKNVKANLFLAQKISTIEVTEDDLFNYYKLHKSKYQETKKEFKVQRIFLNEKEELDLVMDLLRQGKPFTETVKEYSEEQLGVSGGYTGFLGKDDVDPEIWAKLLNLKKWHYTSAKINNGYFVFRYYDTQEVTYTKDFTQVEDEIRKIVMEQKKQEVFDKVIEDLKKKRRYLYLDLGEVMKKLIIIIIIILSAAINAEVIDKIIAKVGRDIILASELETRKQQLNATGMLNEDIGEIDILNEMIESKIVLQRAKDELYEVDDLEVNSLAQEQINRISKDFADQEQFKSVLMEEMGLTVPELKEFYVEMITEQRLKDQIISNEIKTKVHITEAEIEEYFNENISEMPLKPAHDKLGMIVREIKASKETRSQAMQEMNKIIDKLAEGEDFADILKRLPEFGDNISGGDLGFFGKGKMIKTFEDAAFALRPGEVSGIVETMFGFHIIKMEERKIDEIRVSHILKEVVTTQEDVQRTEELMNVILEELKSGKDFSELAREYSEDDSTAASGGVIGEFVPTEYPELFKDQFSALDYGEYSEVIREGDNFYILYKIEQIPEQPYSYDEIYDRLRQIVHSQKEVDLYNNWIKELIKESYVEIFLEE